MSNVVRLIAQGWTAERILEEYPSLERGDIEQALGYAAWLASEEVVPA